MLDEFVPDKFPVDTLQAVLRLLLEERVSIRNLPLIFEAIGEVYGPAGQRRGDLPSTSATASASSSSPSCRRPTARCR